MIKHFIERLFGGPAEWDGTDRRDSLRAKCEFELEVGCPNLRYLGRAVDLSPRGIRIRIRGPWNPRVVKTDQEATLKYLTPLFDAEYDTVKGKIRWVKKEGDNVFSLAVAFDDDVERLKKSWVKSELMKGLKTKVKQKRKELRVRINLPAQLLVDDKTVEGHLRDLSTSGARIECFHAIHEGNQVMVQFGPVKPLPQLRLKAIVRRATKELGTLVYGLRFVFEDQNQQKNVLRYVKSVVDLQNKTKL